MRKENVLLWPLFCAYFFCFQFCRKTHAWFPRKYDVLSNCFKIQKLQLSLEEKCTFFPAQEVMTEFSAAWCLSIVGQAAKATYIRTQSTQYLMSVPLRSERSRCLAGMHWDKAPAEWPRSKGGDPTEGLMLWRLLWKPTPSQALCMSHTGQSQWRKWTGKAGRRRTKRNEKGGGGWEQLNKQLALSKLQTAHVSMTAAREGRSWRASEATPDRGLGCAPIH